MSRIEGERWISSIALHPIALHCVGSLVYRTQDQSCAREQWWNISTPYKQFKQCNELLQLDHAPHSRELSHSVLIREVIWSDLNWNSIWISAARWRGILLRNNFYLINRRIFLSLNYFIILTQTMLFCILHCLCFETDSTWNQSSG